MLVVLCVCLWTPWNPGWFSELILRNCTWCTAAKKGSEGAGSGPVSSVGRWEEVELEVRRAAVREGYVVVHGSSS